MSSYKLIARAAGVLFIVASVAAIVGGLLLLPAVDADYLTAATFSSVGCQRRCCLPDRYSVSPSPSTATQTEASH